MKKIKLACVFLFVIFGITAVLISDRSVRTAQSFSGGPPPGFTGAPGEDTCTACHFAEPSVGQFAILAPETYVPGQTYQIEVRHTTADTTRRRWGFELTALTGNKAAGTFGNLSGNTQILTEAGRFYIEHTFAGTFGGQAGGAQWVFNWVAPTTDVGPVTFYA